MLLRRVHLRVAENAEEVSAILGLSVHPRQGRSLDLDEEIPLRSLAGVNPLEPHGVEVKAKNLVGLAQDGLGDGAVPVDDGDDDVLLHGIFPPINYVVLGVGVGV